MVKIEEEGEEGEEENDNQSLLFQRKKKDTSEGTSGVLYIEDWQSLSTRERQESMAAMNYSTEPWASQLVPLKITSDDALLSTIFPLLSKTFNLTNFQ